MVSVSNVMEQNLKNSLIIRKMYKKDDINKIDLLLKSESDRGVVLVSASFIEYSLQELLSTKLTLTNKQKRDYFKGNGFLSTFSSRIKLARAIELINEETFNNIEAVRGIRNSYAHEFEDKKLIDYKNQIDKIKIPDIGKIKDERKIFINAILTILASLEMSNIVFPNFKDVKENLYQWYKSNSKIEVEVTNAISFISKTV